MTQQNNKSQCDWITIQQAMSLLQVTSRTTVYSLAHKHNIRASKPLGRVYFSYSDIMATLENNSVKMGL